MTHCSITGGKILSCCYCGVQSSFLPDTGKSKRGKSQKGALSTLVCGNCGAPLAVQKARPLTVGKGASLPVSAQTALAQPRIKKSKSSKPSYPTTKPVKIKPRKKRKSLFRKFISEAVDLVEDIFD